MKISLRSKMMCMLAGTCFVSHVNAQNVDVSLQIRPRVEYRHGFGSLVPDSRNYATFTEQRSRLTTNYSDEKLKAKFSMQDIRVWGNQSQLVNNGGAIFAVHEAWAEPILSEKVSVRFGRQELNYDDQRIFGGVDWAQQARSHDAAVLKLKDSTWSLDAGVAYNQDNIQSITTVYTVPKNYKAMQYLWYHTDLGNLGISLLGLNNGMQVIKSPAKSYINYSQTLGTRVTYKASNTELAGSFYYQMGKDADTLDTKIGAYQVSIEAKQKLNDKFKVGLGYERMSGNDQVNGDKTNRAFNPLYGTNHKFNGYMDYFYVGNHAKSVGLNDIYLLLIYTKDRLTFNTDVHFFSAVGNIRDKKAGGNTLAKSNLGTEIDFTLKYKVNNNFKLIGGYSQMLATKSMEYIKGGRADVNNNWAYIMLDFTPTLFKK